MNAGRSADAAHDALDLEAAVVEQLPHTALGRDEVVRVVDVPEEAALLQVVGNDDEEDAARAAARGAPRTTNSRAASMPDMCSST